MNLLISCILAAIIGWIVGTLVFKILDKLNK
jgi:hypothetical protein